MKTVHSFIIAFVAFILSALWAGAQGNYKNVELSISHRDGQYRKNETVEVWAFKHQEDGEPLRLTAIENGRRSKQALELKAGEKTLILSKVYPEPTAVILQVAPENDSKTFSAVGFIVAPDEFRPGFEEPADFTDYWAKQVKKLRRSKMKALLTPVPSGKEGIEAYDLEISMPEGNPVRAYIAWPQDPEPGSLGILIIPHGSGVRSSNLKNAVSRAKSSHSIVIDINAHGVVNGQSDAYYEDLSNGELKDYRTKHLTVPEDCYFRLMYLRMQRVLDYACTLKQWDGKHVALDGTSQGGGQSAALAGMDARVGFVILQVPALTDMGGHLAGHGGSWPYYGKFDEERDGDWQRAVPYYDAVNFLRHYKGILWMEGGLIDTTCPSECVFAAYNVAATPLKHMATYPFRQHGEKRLWEANYAEWRETILQPRKEALELYLKGRHTYFSQFLRPDSLQVAEIWQPEGETLRVAHHGPAVENQFMALRIYFDARAAIDVYSKSGLIDNELGWWRWYPTPEEQEAHGAGCDEYYVGKTVGLGGIQLWDGEKAVPLATTAGRRSLVGRTDNGAFMEMISYGIPYLQDTVDVSLRIDVSDDSRWAMVSVKELNGNPVSFVTGVNYHPGSKIIRQEGLAAVWGEHPANISAHPIPIGGAIRFNPHDFQIVEDADNAIRLISKPLTEFRTQIISASEKESELNTAKRFFEFVKK